MDFYRHGVLWPRKCLLCSGAKRRRAF
jgi:hypothetical protein